MGSVRVWSRGEDGETSVGGGSKPWTSTTLPGRVAAPGELTGVRLMIPTRLDDAPCAASNEEPSNPPVRRCEPLDELFRSARAVPPPDHRLPPIIPPAQPTLPGGGLEGKCNSDLRLARVGRSKISGESGDLSHRETSPRFPRRVGLSRATSFLS